MNFLSFINTQKLIIFKSLEIIVSLFFVFFLKIVLSKSCLFIFWVSYYNFDRAVKIQWVLSCLIVLHFKTQLIFRQSRYITGNHNRILLILSCLSSLSSLLISFLILHESGRFLLVKVGTWRQIIVPLGQHYGLQILPRDTARFRLSLNLFTCLAVSIRVEVIVLEGEGEGLLLLGLIRGLLWFI